MASNLPDPFKTGEPGWAPKAPGDGQKVPWTSPNTRTPNTPDGAPNRVPPTFPVKGPQ